MDEQKICWPELTGDPEIGKWYRISPQGAVCADGSPWHGTIYKGNENKMIVYFCGGGVSVDEYTAARSEQFFFSSADRDGFELVGMPANSEANPFRNWSKILLPYATGDFHIGNGDFHYTDLNGNPSVIHHHGYTNCMQFLHMAMTYFDQLEAIVIAGFSAGGFGVSMLADEIIPKFFSEVKNVTAVIDSSLLISENWREIAKNVWHSPKHLIDKTSENNLALSHLKYLSNHLPFVKILFTSSVRDVDLVRYNAYLNKGVFEAHYEDGNAYQEELKKMAEEILSWQNTAVLFWDELMAQSEDKLTQHTIIFMPTFYALPVQGTTVASWVMNAVNDRLENTGLSLLDKRY